MVVATVAVAAAAAAAAAAGVRGVGGTMGEEGAHHPAATHGATVGVVGTAAAEAG
jgi:hypothetical protein